MKKIFLFLVLLIVIVISQTTIAKEKPADKKTENAVEKKVQCKHADSETCPKFAECKKECPKKCKKTEIKCETMDTTKEAGKKLK